MMKRMLTFVFFLSCALCSSTIAVSGGQQHAPIRLLLIAEKGRYLPYEPIKFRLRIRNEATYPVCIYLYDLWWEDGLIRIGSPQGSFQSLSLTFDGIWLQEPAYAKPTLIKPGECVESSPTWLLEEWEETAEVIDDSFYLARRKTFVLEMHMWVGWAPIWARRTYHAVLTVKKMIKVIEPRTERENSVLVMLDYWRGRPRKRQEVEQTFQAYNIPYDEGGIQCSPLEFLRIVRDVAKGTGYESEAACYYAFQLEDEGRIEQAKTEYRRIVGKYSNTWWAYKAQEALKELQQSGK